MFLFFMVCLYHFYPWTNFQNDALYFIQFLSYVKCMLFRYPIRNVFVIVNRQKITKPPLYNLLSCINCNTFTFSPTSTQPLPMPCLQQTRLQHMPLKCMHMHRQQIKWGHKNTLLLSLFTWYFLFIFKAMPSIQSFICVEKHTAKDSAFL